MHYSFKPAVVSRILGLLIYVIHTLIKKAEKDGKISVLTEALSKIKFGVVLPDGNRMLIRPLVRGDTEALSEIYFEKVYNWLEQNIKPNTILIDAGAHIGLFTVRATRILGRKGTIVTIEPHPENYQLLLRNVALNSLKNVIPVNVALSDTGGLTELYVSHDTSAHSLIPYRSRRRLIVKCETMDNLLSKLKLSWKTSVLVKMDVEGSELKALSGAQNLLNRTNTKILIECHSKMDDTRRICEYLSRQAFETRIVIKSGRPYIYAKKCLDEEYDASAKPPARAL